MTVIPLRYVSAPTIADCWKGFATRPGTVRADPSGRLMLVVGTGEERRTAHRHGAAVRRRLDARAIGRTVSRSITAAPARSPANSKRSWISGEAGLGHGLVKLQDVTAQNAVLVVAARPALLAAAQRWIERLDSRQRLRRRACMSTRCATATPSRSRSLLNAMFGGGGAAGETDANQLAPGAGAKTLSAVRPAHRRSPVLDRTRRRAPAGADSAGGGLGGGGLGGGGGRRRRHGRADAGSPFGGLQTAALSSAFAAAGQGGDDTRCCRACASPPTPPTIRCWSTPAPKATAPSSARLQQIDRPKAQVAIDVTIAEVTLNDQLNYGVQFYLANHIGLGRSAIPAAGSR